MTAHDSYTMTSSSPEAQPKPKPQPKPEPQPKQLGLTFSFRTKLTALLVSERTPVTISHLGIISSTGHLKKRYFTRGLLSINDVIKA